mgnify:FL=1|jgi:hypothetical protein
MRQIRYPLLVTITGALLVGCGTDGSSGTAPSPAVSSATLSATGADATPAATPAGPTPSSTAPPETSPLTREKQAALRAAIAMHSAPDLGRCTRSTPLTNRACGRELTTAGKVVNETVRRLRASQPEHATLLYGPILATAAELRKDLERLRDPIPCYGLSDAPQPPPPLAAEAQEICAEAADIVKTRYRVFLTQIDV